MHNFRPYNIKGLMAKKKKKKSGAPKPKRGKKMKSILRKAIIDVFIEAGNTPLNYKQVAKRLNLKDTAQRMVVNEILHELVVQDLIKEISRGKFKADMARPFVVGEVSLTSRGAAYVITDDLEEDVFVAPKNTNTALNGDKVKVYLNARKKFHQPSGEIVEILERAKTQFVGTIEKTARYAFVIPDDRKMPVDIYIPEGNIHDARHGDKVVVKITEWPRGHDSPIGEVIDVLGTPGVHETEMHAILAEFGLPAAFTKEIEDASEKIPDEITEEEIKKREDFRDVVTFTIDPEDAKDFDDALSFRKLKNGRYEVGVHIADVTHYVITDSLLDQEAYDRATSVYLVDRVIPMLPERLSNGLCSLRPNETKLTFSTVFEMDESGKVYNYRIGRTVIHSNKRFTYDDAQQIIEKGNGEFAEEVLTLDKIAKALRAKRFEQGSIGFDKMEVKFTLADDGTPEGVYFKVSKDANKLIEEFMLLANKTVATHIGKPKDNSVPKPFVYRIHDSPDPARLEDFSRFVKNLGFKVNVSNPDKAAESINKLMEEVKGKGYENTVEQLAIRSMAKAEYSPDNIGHYGLGFKYYTHFTSPIRRYPDMMVHRLLAQYAANKTRQKKKTLETKCKHCSAMEKVAVDAERTSIKYKQVEYMMDKVGEVFAGVVSGVSEYGIFVEIIENKCEGMVRLKNISDDFYFYDEENMRVVGRRYGTTYQIGSRVQVLVKKANLARRQLDFELVDSAED